MAVSKNDEIFMLLEHLKQEVQSEVDAFTIKVKDESIALNLKLERESAGRCVIEKAIVTLTGMLLKLKDLKTVKVLDLPEEAELSAESSLSSSVTSFSQVLERLGSLEAKMTASEVKQSELEAKQEHQEKSAERPSALERNLTNLNQDVKLLKDRCHELENNQDQFCLKSELEAAKTEFLSKQSELEEKCEDYCQLVSAVSKEGTSIRENLYTIQNELVQNQAKRSKDVDGQINSLKSECSQLNDRMTGFQISLSGIVEVENGMRPKLEELESKTLAVECWVDEVEVRTAELEERTVEMERQSLYTQSINQKTVASINRKYGEMNALICTKVKKLERLKTVLNNIRTRSAIGAKVNAMEKRLMEMSLPAPKPVPAFNAHSIQNFEKGGIVTYRNDGGCNRGNALDASSGVFTCPQDGCYGFGVTVFWKFIYGALGLEIVLKNKEAKKTLAKLGVHGGSSVCQLRTGDTVHLEMTNENPLFKTNYVSEEVKMFFFGWWIG